MSMFHILEAYQQLVPMLSAERPLADRIRFFGQWLAEIYEPEQGAIFLADGASDRWQLVWTCGLDEGELSALPASWTDDPSPWESLPFRAHPRPNQGDMSPGAPFIVQPIQHESQVLGMICMVPGRHGQGQATDHGQSQMQDGEMELLLSATSSIFGMHLWWGMEQRRTAAEMRRLEVKSNQLAVLHRIGQSLAATLDIGQLCHIAHSEIAKLMDCPNFGISIYDAVRQEIRPIYLIGDGAYIDISNIPALPLEPETGIQSKAIVAKRPLVVPDLEALRKRLQSFHRIESSDRRSARAAIVAPMLAGDKVIGTLQIQSYQADIYTQADVDLLDSIASQLGVALENARLYAESQRRVHDMEGVNHIYRLLQSQESLDSKIAAMLDESLALVGTDAGAIWLHDPDRNILVEKVSRGWFRDLDVHELKPHQGVTGKVFTSGEMVVSDEFIKLTAVLAESRTRVPPGWGGAAVPLKSNQRPVGVLFVSVCLPRRLTPEEVNLIAVLGQIAGSALHQSGLALQLQVQAQRLQQVVDAVSEGLVLLDGAHTVVLANPAAQIHLAGLTGQDVHPDDRLTHLAGEPIDQVLARAISAVSAAPAESQRVVLAVDGPAPRIFEIGGYPLYLHPTETAQQPGDKSAQPQNGWVVLLRDVTQVRLAQDRMQEQERLAALGQMAAGIAHDFNNIIAVILLYAELMQRSKTLGAKDLERLDIIHAQAGHAAQLVQQILDFGRRAVMKREAIDVAKLMEQIVKLLNRALPENISVLWKHPAGTGEFRSTVLADPTRLQQAMMNLAVNARDAMPQGGTLTFDLSIVESVPMMVSHSPVHRGSGRWICIRVEDTGVGIPVDVLPHIFEPFFTSKAPGQGTGLGLAQVYGIVMQHEGFIDVTTQEGKGTTFVIYLPQAKDELPEPPSQISVQRRGQGETLLVVEDNPATASALQDILGNQGYQVLLARNGEHALEFIAEHGDKIGLVLTDLVMPGMGGRELAAHVRVRLPHLRIVAMSGYPQGAQDAERLGQDFDAWIQKPFEMDMIIQLIQQNLERNDHS